GRRRLLVSGKRAHEGQRRSSPFPPNQRTPTGPPRLVSALLTPSMSSGRTAVRRDTRCVQKIDSRAVRTWDWNRYAPILRSRAIPRFLEAHRDVCRFSTRRTENAGHRAENKATDV